MEDTLPDKTRGVPVLIFLQPLCLIYSTGLVTTVVKTSAADMFAQKVSDLTPSETHSNECFQEGSGRVLGQSMPLFLDHWPQNICCLVDKVNLCTWGFGFCIHDAETTR